MSTTPKTTVLSHASQPGWRIALAFICACGMLACESNGPANAEAASTAPAKTDSATSIESVTEKAINDATKEAGAEHLFDPEDKSIRKRACDFLTADMISDLFGVPAGELKQIKIMGCIYAWENDGQIMEAKLMMPRVHKTTKGAATWFKNATATKTKEQADAEMDRVKEKLKERKELDTKTKKRTASNLADIAKMGTPDEGVRYEDVTGFGDEARVSSADGAMWIRIQNLTFQLAAYQGPKQPQPQFDPKNPMAIVKAAMDAQKKWLADTLVQRKNDVKKLAPAVVKAVTAR